MPFQLLWGIFIFWLETCTWSLFPKQFSLMEMVTECHKLNKVLAPKQFKLLRGFNRDVMSRVKNWPCTWQRGFLGYWIFSVKNWNGSGQTRTVTIPTKLSLNFLLSDFCHSKHLHFISYHLGMPWRRKWQLTIHKVLGLPGKSHGQEPGRAAVRHDCACA